MRKASERVCESEVVSQLDVDVLRQKMREMYDFLLTADYQESIVETFIEQEPVLEIELKEEKPVIEEEKQEVIELVEEKVELVEEKIELEIEPIKVEEEKVEIAEEKAVVVEERLEFVEEKVEKVEEKVVLEVELPKVVEPEIVFEEPVKQPEIETPKASSVLDYLHNNIMRDNEPKQAKKEEYTTLDLFKTKTSIAEQFENKNRSDLRTAIGVGEKFMFINDLFSGDLKAYTNFINILNEADSLEMSMVIIEENRSKRKWIKNSLAYSTLENLVEKRFRK
jgi:hypothetical protein